MRVDEICRPWEVSCLNVCGCETHLYTMSPHWGNVSEFLNLSAYALCGCVADKIVVITPIPIHLKVDAIAEETCRKAEVQLMLLLVCEILVCKVLYIEHRLTNACKWSPRCLATDFNDSIWNAWTLSGKWIGCTKREVWESWCVLLKEILLVNIPWAWHIPCRQPTGRTALTHTVGSLIAVSSIQSITTFIWVCSVSKESRTTLVFVF